MSRSPCEQSAQVAAYALGSLEDDEAVRFGEHLASCSECTRELAELQLVVDRLPEAVPPAIASPALKERVMSVVRSEAELLRAAGPQADRPAPARRRRRPLFTFAGALGLAAAAVLVVVIAVGGAGSSVRTTMGHTAWATASVVLRQSGGRAELDVIGVPAPAPDRIYQVWLERAQRPPTPTDALFGVNRRGDAAVVVPGSLHGVQHVLVTAEPLGGSPNGRPSGPPVMMVALNT